MSHYGYNDQGYGRGGDYGRRGGGDRGRGDGGRYSNDNRRDGRSGFDRGGSFGGGGRSFRGGYGGGGGRGNNPPPPKYSEKRDPGDIEVITNYFPLQVKGKPADITIYQYHVRILNVKKVFIKDDQGEILKDDRNNKRYDLVPSEDSDLYKDRHGVVRDTASDLTRRVLTACRDKIQKDHGKFIISDGSSAVFTIQPLYDQDEINETLPPQKKAKHDNYYGPDASEGHMNEDEKNESSSNSWWEVDVRIRDDEDENVSRKKFFKVRFFLKAKLPLQFDGNLNKIVVAAEHKFKIINLLNMGIKSSMIDAGLRTFDKDAKNFFPTDMELQRQLMSGIQPNSTHVVPITGLSEVAQISKDDKLFVMANFCMKWANKKVPIFDRRTKTILGVPVDLSRLPLSEETLDKIHGELRKIRFHVEYDKGQKWEDDMKRKSKPYDNRIFTKRGTCRLYKSQQKQRNEELRATAEDHSFPVKDMDGNENIVTVMKHYQSRGVHVEYPLLPIVRISKDEWFPIEFIMQAFCSKRVSNTPENIQIALRFNDQYPGKTRIDRMTHLIHDPVRLADSALVTCLAASRDNQVEFFSKLCLEIEQEPYSVKAQCLKYPNIEFESSTVEGREGTWNTNRLTFKKPVTVASFAVVDCCGRGSENIPKHLIDICKSHGMNFPDNSESMMNDLVRVTGTGEGQLRSAIRGVISSARNFFLADARQVLSPRQMFFRSYSKLQGRVYPCLVNSATRTRDENGDDKFDVYLQNNANLHGNGSDWEPTHKVIMEGNDKPCYARLQYGVDDEESSLDGSVLDLFEVNYKNGSYNATIGAEQHRFSKVVLVFKIRVKENPEEYEYEPMHQFTEQTQQAIHSTFEIECPSIIFFLTPNTDSMTYNKIKEICRLEHGVQSQVLVVEKYKTQRNPDMYLSGVALKVNSKLSHVSDSSTAWTVEGYPWMQEAHTLVLGYSMSANMGQDNNMCVSVTALLDRQGLTISEDFGMQPKDKIVAPELLKAQVAGLARDYYDFNNAFPMRVVVYRNGGQEGIFNDIKLQELRAIKAALEDVLAEIEQENGVLLKKPLVTLIIAQSYHGVQIVPRVPRGRDNNVPSGTCVDLGILGIQNLSVNEVNDELNDLLPVSEDYIPFDGSSQRQSNFDFQLIPHKGLKGTSKPVFYRSIWNENYLYKHEASHTQLNETAMKNVTFGLSFHYGTATKATRLLSVLDYSDRMANAGLSCTAAIRSKQADGVFPSWKSNMAISTSYHLHQTA